MAYARVVVTIHGSEAIEYVGVIDVARSSVSSELLATSESSDSAVECVEVLDREAPVSASSLVVCVVAVDVARSCVSCSIRGSVESGDDVECGISHARVCSSMASRASGDDRVPISLASTCVS